ncbi:MAG: tRNA dihydrouridine synthase DusB [Fimbriimonadales bacterium]
MSFNVGPIRVNPPVLLAPMEDVTNAAFRGIAKEVAKPGLMFTEFVSAMAVHHNAKKTIKKMIVSDSERPLGIQIFGAEPDVMAETARLCEEMGADIVDINMGCWVPKVCKTGSGAALLKDPVAAEKIVRAVVDAVKVPVTVKVRAGWTYDLFAAPDLAKRFQEAGIKMLTLHARFAKQGFEGEADWKLIEQLRSAVTVPLIGNGDIRQPEDALKMMRETGCDGVMVGRAAISNPWRLRQIVDAVSGRAISEDPTINQRIETALLHLRRHIDHESKYDPGRGETPAIRSLRGQIPIYIKGVPGAAALRGEIVTAETYDDIESRLRQFEAEAARFAITA